MVYLNPLLTEKARAANLVEGDAYLWLAALEDMCHSAGYYIIQAEEPEEGGGLVIKLASIGAVTMDVMHDWIQHWLRERYRALTVEFYHTRHDLRRTTEDRLYFTAQLSFLPPESQQ